MAEKLKKLSTEPYKGVRDFFPEEMAVQNYIFGVWRRTAESFGYEEYGASVLEPAELYQAKTGEEIVNEQTYTFIDRGDRKVTLRPEMTPTAARMVAMRRRQLALPLRWYSIPNLFRYEQPQRGRLREHWQLNADLFGVEGIEADAEIIALAGAIMKAFGAKEEDFEIRVSNRKAIIKALQERLPSAENAKIMMKLMDKKEKDPQYYDREAKKLLGEDISMAFEADARTESVLELLAKRGVKNARFDESIVRGFDYYTDLVFEIFDTSRENRRALFGGGRYDELTSLFNDEAVPAIGFGMGDVTIRDFLETHKLLPTPKGATKIHICTLERKFMPNAEELAERLRLKGVAVSVNLTDKKVGDQISWANKHRIPFIVCIGEEEAKTGRLKVKNLETGKEVETTAETVDVALPL